MNESALKSNIAITGLTAAGKTTHSRIIEKEFGHKYFSASSLLAEISGYKEEVFSGFWLTTKGHEMASKVIDSGIDEALKKKEEDSAFTIFDCRTLPWLSKKNVFSVWIESSLESRTYKALISHGPSETRTFDDLKKEISYKDNRDCDSFRQAFGFDILKDLEPLDVIIDISSFIKSPTIKSSWESIQQGQDIISSAVGLYITGDDFYRKRMKILYDEFGTQVFRRFSDRYQQILNG
jgi:cytidylate kinase